MEKNFSKPPLFNPFDEPLESSYEFSSIPSLQIDFTAEFEGRPSLNYIPIALRDEPDLGRESMGILDMDQINLNEDLFLPDPWENQGEHKLGTIVEGQVASFDFSPNPEPPVELFSSKSNNIAPIFSLKPQQNASLFDTVKCQTSTNSVKAQSYQSESDESSSDTIHSITPEQSLNKSPEDIINLMTQYVNSGNFTQEQKSSVDECLKVLSEVLIGPDQSDSGNGSTSHQVNFETLKPLDLSMKKTETVNCSLKVPRKPIISLPVRAEPGKIVIKSDLKKPGPLKAVIPLNSMSKTGMCVEKYIFCW